MKDRSGDNSQLGSSDGENTQRIPHLYKDRDWSCNGRNLEPVKSITRLKLIARQLMQIISVSQFRRTKRKIIFRTDTVSESALAVVSPRYLVGRENAINFGGNP
jgi:hypothetical protein